MLINSFTGESVSAILSITPGVKRKLQFLVPGNAWVNQYEFQRPCAAPPRVPKDRWEVLRKACKAKFEDSEVKAEANKAKLVMEYVSADEINGLVKEILNI